MSKKLAFSNDLLNFGSLINWCENRHRYILDDASRHLIDEILKIGETRAFSVSSIDIFYRAQLGCEFERQIGAFATGASPYGESRMKPKKEGAIEGRLNPKGISYLYMAESEVTAVAEVRPTVAANITLGVFKPIRELKIAAFSAKNCVSKSTPLIEQNLSELVQSHLGRPVQKSDEVASYAVTQLIAEYLRFAGFDGVFYPSSVAEGGNYAMFNPDDFEMQSARVVVVKSVEHNYIDANGTDFDFLT